MPNKLVDIDIEAVASVDKAANRRRFLIIKRADDNVDKAMWSTAMMNDFPDSSFAYVESGGEKDSDDKTMPRGLRHLPYKDADGKIDPVHVRNALARLSQTMIPDAAKEQARRKLVAAARQVGIEVSKQDEPEPGLIRRMITAIGKALSLTPEQLAKAEDVVVKEYDDMPRTTNEIMEHRKAMEEFMSLRGAFMSSLNSIMENSNHPEHAEMLQRSVKEFADAANPVISRMRMRDMRKAEEMLEDLDAAAGDIPQMSRVIKAFESFEGHDKSPVNQPSKESEGERSMKLADVLKAVGIDLDKQVEGQPSGGGTNTVVNKVEESAEIKKQFADLQKQADEAKAQVAELRKAAEDAEIRAKAAEAVAKAEQEKRVQREYLEKAAQYPHMGAAEEVAKRLRKAYELDEEFGKQLEADFAKANAAIETSKLFDEAGRVGVVKEGSANAKLEALAKSVVAKDANMTYEQAFDKVMQTPEGARLYEESLREKGVN